MLNSSIFLIMPTAKSKRFQNKQREKRKRKRQKLVGLSKRDLRALELQRLVYRPDFFKSGNSRTLAEVNSFHRKDFVKIIHDLKRNFPNEQLEVLDEGAGNSSFGKELQENVKTQTGLEINVTRTDLQGVADSRPHSPQELFKHFGRNKFHLIVSTFGGTTYSHSIQKSVSNLISVLKPGGVASLLLQGSKERLEQIKKLGRVFPNAHLDFFVYKYPSNTNAYGCVLTIKKTG